MSYISLEGRLTKDPKDYTTNEGKILAFLDLAENSIQYDKTTQKWEELGTEYYKATLTGTKAIDALDQLHKGDKIHVEGNLTHKKYVTETGVEGTEHRIFVQKIGRPLARKVDENIPPVSVSTPIPETPPF